MWITKGIEKWGDTHHPKLLDVLRMLLGVFLFMKGLAFYNNMPFLRDLIVQNKVMDLSSSLVEKLLYYVSYAHLVGGILIFLGLATRISCIIQLPIVLSAVFIINIFMSPINSELWLSIIILAQLILFAILGSGPLSLDDYLSKSRPVDH